MFINILDLITVQFPHAGHARRETQTETQVRHPKSFAQHNTWKGLSTVSQNDLYWCLQHLSSVNQQTGVKPQDLPTSSSSYIYSKISTEEEKRPATRTEKDASSVTYAALNHQLPPDAPVRPRRPKEESSEYADIRGWHITGVGRSAFSHVEVKEMTCFTWDWK